MIYQCYFEHSQVDRLFQFNAYTGFGLEPEVNPQITLNCPELGDRDTRLQLTEYAALLWHFRNPTVDADDWLGFTSYRQLDKSAFIIQDRKEVDKYLKDADGFTWGFMKMVDEDQIPISLARHTDICHPGLNEFIEHMLKRHDVEMPRNWFRATQGVFANYWVLKKPRFTEYMKFSWPIVLDALAEIKTHPFYYSQHSFGTVTKQKCIGYFMERLFIIWMFIKAARLRNPSVTEIVINRERC
jgi:hypothetical protein